MKALLAETAAGALSVALYLLGAGFMTALGVSAELSGAARLLSGEFMLGLWLSYMGGIALFVGLYLLGYRRLVPAVLARSPAG